MAVCQALNLPTLRSSSQASQLPQKVQSQVGAMADSVPLKRLVTRLLILVLAMFAFGFALCRSMT